MIHSFEVGFRAFISGISFKSNPTDRYSQNGRRWSRGWMTAELVHAKSMAQRDVETSLDLVLGKARAGEVDEGDEEAR